MEMIPLLFLAVLKARDEARKKEEETRLAREEADRKAEERAREEAGRKEAERKERERRAQEDAEKRKQEDARREEERLEREEARWQQAELRRWIREEAEERRKEKIEEEKRRAREAETRRDEERKAREEAERERRAREDAERRWREEAQSRADAERRAEEERRAREEERRAREEAEKKREEERKAREDAERKQEEERKAREEAERKQEEERKAREDAERKEEEERKAREDAERREEEERQARENGIEPEYAPVQSEIDEAKQRLGYREGGVNIAICGTAGSGKSSLINAFRGLRNNDIGAAATGSTETTLETSSFSDPRRNSRFVWYDIPGGGTQMISDWQYFRRQALFIFDYLIVSYDTRFRELDAKILKKYQQYGPGNPPRAFIVRSKSDQHIMNIAIDMGYESDDDDPGRRSTLYADARSEYINMTKRDLKSNLERYGLPQQRVYMVSKGVIVKLMLGKTPANQIDEKDLLTDLGLLPPT